MRGSSGRTGDTSWLGRPVGRRGRASGTALAIALSLLLLGLAPGVGGAAQPVAPRSATVTDVTLAPDAPSGQLVGTTVLWTAGAPGAQAPLYQFSVAWHGLNPSVVQDFSPRNTFAWTPIREGTHYVQVAVKESGEDDAAAVKLAQPFTVESRATAGQPVVTPTSHPLVVLYSAPPCTGSLKVQFGFGLATRNWQSTPEIPCTPNRSVNLYVAGMRADTTYALRHVVRDGTTVTPGPLRFHRTGRLGVLYTPISVPDPAGVGASLANDVVFLSAAQILPDRPTGLAADLAGNVIWYYDPARYADLPSDSTYFARPVTGGTVLTFVGAGLGPRQALREIDLAGNTLRETTVGRLNEQLARRGDDQISEIHHEAIRFPNGQTLILAYVERIYEDIQGATGPVDVLGDMAIALDRDFQVVWTWNTFDHLDVTRAATLGETCSAGSPGCPALGPQLAPVANDWTHANTIAYSPSDGNLLVSMRHQDWIVKVDYQDGAGSGAVIWRLGLDGDFTVEDPGGSDYPWFSHQHGTENLGNRLVTFDNGNTRCASVPVGCNSRGQVFELDEVSRVARLVLNADLGYSRAVGYGQTLLNGSYAFTSGMQGPPPQVFGQSIEVTPDGRQVYTLQTEGTLYHSFRLASMYGYR